MSQNNTVVKDPPMTRTKVEAILANISYKDWTFYLGEKNGELFIQIRFMAPDMYSGTFMMQYCRKWQLSKWMVPTEIVRTCHKAVQAAVEHEADECFMYKGKRIFSPHIDTEAMLALAGKIEVRT